MNTGVHKPAAIVTGQQIRVDVPEQGTMNFVFELTGQTLPVPVSNEWATRYKHVMTSVLAQREKYLSLRVDERVPTWVFHQREFSFPQDRVPPEEVLRLKDRTLMRMPSAALQEVQRVKRACDVSLWKYDRDTQAGTPIPPANWKPAILLRFPLKAPARPDIDQLGADEQVFELSGTPQGERYYLDRLGLFSEATPEVDVEGVDFFLEEKPDATADPIDSWTIARTNLTEQSRPGTFMRVADDIPRPYVATKKEPIDTLRLLQLLSITNSGGYFVRVPSAKTYATLIVCVTLKPRISDALASVTMPLAANAVLYDNALPPDVVRFEVDDSIHIAPFAPVGHVAFGWLRPGTKDTPEDKFGYHTISLVEYRGIDAAGTVLQDLDSVTAISPLSELPAQTIERNASPRADDRATDPTGSQGGVAAIRLLSRHQLKALIDSGRVSQSNDDQRSFRGQMCCYDEVGGESPYKPLGSEARRNITVTPGLRDVFGNRFLATSGEIKRRLFYTDALIAPAEWPGFRFSVFPTVDAGIPSISLEVCYTPTDNEKDRAARYSRLVEIRRQIEGARSDVQVQLIVHPLLQVAIDLTTDLIAWLVKTLIPLESPTRKVKPDPRFLPLPPFHCDGTVFNIPKLFQARIEIVRTDPSLLPQTAHRPSNKTLSQIIYDEIAKASSTVMCAEAASPILFREASRKDEFRAVAQAFEEVFSTAYAVKVGFLRNQLNQHELWFVPSELFPTAKLDPAEQRKWTFSTARPLSNKLGTDTFEVPLFAGGEGEKYWHGFPLRSIHFVEQDYDELGRAAFGLIEKVFTPSAVSEPSDARSVRDALKAKEAIAKRLAEWDQGLGSPTYMIPMFPDQTTADGAAVSRLAGDAFLKAVTAFYNIDTVVQLPLERLGDKVSIAMFHGKVISPFTSSTNKNKGVPASRLPGFSDVLLAGGEQKVTVLYDVPPGTNDPNSTDEVPVIKEADQLEIIFTHVQLKSEIVKDTENTSFSLGRWLELVSPLALAWHGIGTPIPVALRRFPLKPSIDVPSVKVPQLKSNKIGKQEVGLLIKWGWEMSFVAEGTETDIVHTTIRYNEPETTSVTSDFVFDTDWEPRSLLHCLVVFKLLSDQWGVISPDKRMPVLSSLMGYLQSKLATPQTQYRVAADQPSDTFDIRFHPLRIEKPQCLVMQKLEPLLARKVDPGFHRFTIVARGESDDNRAFLISRSESPPAVYNLRPSLRLTRNEKIGSRLLDSRLIFECALVEAPREYWARNSWTDVLQYQPTEKQDLAGSLIDFIVTLLNGADVASLALEVNAALYCRREALSIFTPFSLIPSDMMPSGSTAATEIATRIHSKFEAFVKDHGLPKEVDESWLRLRIKISQPKSSFGQRTLIEIAAIDFPLATPAAKKRLRSKLKKK